MVQKDKNQSIEPLFNIMADQVTDTSIREQLGPVFLYTTVYNVVERHFGYANCKELQGSQSVGKLS